MDRMYSDEPNNKKKLPQYISIISATQCARIRIADIECIEQEGRRLHIITAEKDYTMYESMSNIISSLAERAFFRPMKGLIINFDHVKDITGSYINFYSGQTVTMGKNSAGRTRQAFRKYLMKYPPYNKWEPENRVMEIRRSKGKNYDVSWDFVEDERPYNPKFDEELQPTAYKRMKDAGDKPRRKTRRDESIADMRIKEEDSPGVKR